MSWLHITWLYESSITRPTNIWKTFQHWIRTLCYYVFLYPLWCDSWLLLHSYYILKVEFRSGAQCHFLLRCTSTMPSLDKCNFFSPIYLVSKGYSISRVIFYYVPLNHVFTKVYSFTVSIKVDGLKKKESKNYFHFYNKRIYLKVNCKLCPGQKQPHNAANTTLALYNHLHRQKKLRDWVNADLIQQLDPELQQVTNGWAAKL